MRLWFCRNMNSKNIEVTRGISTILYQLAVGAKVILSL
mgnify:CR=1 FL=1